MDAQQWVIQTTWFSGGIRTFYGLDGGLTSIRRNARRYPSFNEAFMAAVSLHDALEINEFEVIDVTPGIRCRTDPNASVTGSTREAQCCATET
jgi:hypothetical protein